MGWGGELMFKFRIWGGGCIMWKFWYHGKSWVLVKILKSIFSGGYTRKMQCKGDFSCQVNV